MTSEWQKMIAGELYDPNDPELVQRRYDTRQFITQFNHSVEPGDRERILRRLLPRAGADLYVEPPFRCDYGTNIIIGRKVYFNFDCVILDVAEVTIGDYCLFGPGVHIYAAMHPVDHELRRTRESGKPVRIGNDVWVGGRVVILPGVTIGDRAILGAGSVVTRDVPSDVVAAGNPCRIIKELR
jgi:maltose O-acetyltransferase